MGASPRAGILLALGLAWAGCGSDADVSPSRGPTPGGSVRVISAEPAGDTDAGGLEPDAGGPVGEDAGVALPSLVLEDPMDGAMFPRDAVEAHAWVAAVPLRARATGVTTVEFYADDRVLVARAASAPFVGVGTLSGEGTRRIVARGLDASGAEVARDEATITVLAPTDSGCHAMLDALGLDWAPVGATLGIADPVRVQPIIHDVSFRYVSNTMPTAMLMDCSLAPRLVEVAELVKTHGIDEVVHIGIYNYRCIGGGDPATGCTPSQHAYAKAIDFHAFGLAGSDIEHNVETDWVITGGDVCPGAPSGEADRVLHSIACSLWSDRIFQIVLTPNYNAAHRNHFHVDETSGSMFIGSTVSGIDPLVPNLD